MSTSPGIQTRRVRAEFADEIQTAFVETVDDGTGGA